MRQWKSILSCAVCAGMMLAPVNGLPQDAGVSITARAAESGTFGGTVKWTLDDAGTLTISGTGEMLFDGNTETSKFSGNVPWNNYRSTIKTVIIGKGVTSLDFCAFAGCESLTSVTIPDSVTSIGGDAFAYCTNLTSVTIPDSVTSIGDRAFKGCTSLTSVTIPDSVTSIGGDAFAYCTSLTSVTIPDSVTHIGWWAFDGCTSLTSVTIPDSVTSIGNVAFAGCTSLTSIQVSGSNQHYKSVDGVLFTKDMKAIHTYPAGKTDTEYNIPDSVTSIGETAFYYCTSLTSVTIPDSVTSIGRAAFADCTSLTTVIILNPECEIYDNSFTFRNEYDDGKSLFTGTIYGYKGSTAETYAQKYGRNFELARAAESGTCGENLTWTLDYAGTLTISGTGKMQDYPYSNNAPWYTKRDSIKEVVIQKGVTSIGEDAFAYCTSLTSVTIPDSVTSIQYGAFRHCTSLTSVTIPDSVTSIGDSAFSGCKSLTSVTIPDSVTSIGDWAFNYCESLTSVTIPDSVTSIEWCAFYHCTSLTSVTIPDSVTSIEYEAFEYCTSLTSVTILNPECKIFDSRSTFCNESADGKYPFTGTIYGYKGSTAEAYAQKYDRKFEVISSAPSPTEPAVSKYSPGDANGDSVINAKDATLVLIAAARIGTGGDSNLSAKERSAADVNADGDINAKDATIILRYAAAIGAGRHVEITDFV